MNKDLLTISGVGEKVNRYFRQKGLWNTYDLITYLPKKYSDFAVTSFDMLKDLDVVTVVGTISSELKTFKKKVELTTTKISLDEHLINLSIFGRGYLDKQLKTGDLVLVKGKYNFFKNEITVLFISKHTNIPEIKPIYDIDHIPDSNVSKIIKTIFEENSVDIYETLPDKLITKYGLISRKEALYQLHFPTSQNDLEQAFLRQKYEEALLHLLSYHMYKAPKQKRDPILYDIHKVKSYIKRLPYQLTFDQQEAVNDIFKDYKQDDSTYRLIQGDVGSGKTFVTFIAVLGMITAGYQVAFMAPTELLAKQHHENFNKYFSDIESCILTSSSKDKSSLLDEVSTGLIKVVFGTHMLALDATKFNNLGLVIIDEQHKFGVDIRDNLIRKSVTKDTIYLSATPIPRSLTLTFFGDLEVSSIKQKPVKKAPIHTRIINQKVDEEIIRILKQTQSLLQQSFVVVPSILENLNKDSIESTYDRLKPYFSFDDLYVVHGKLKMEEIDLVMDRFIKNPKGILLSTTIIEVGIDVKNATTMIILGAEHFGLSQLHQIRGRVGRGNLQGNCYLVSKKTDVARLDFLEKTDDGFLLSAYDLKLRGPGVFSGIIQSGQVKFKYLDLGTDMNIIKQMKVEAKYYLAHIDKYLYLKKRIQQIVI